MSEFAPQPHPNESLRIQDKELAHLGALVIEAALRQDLEQVAAEHVERTGVENPNSHADNRLRVGQGAVAESSDGVYRQIDQNGILDLAESGIVRGAYTAGKRSKTSGHTTYWTNGETGKSSSLGQGFVLKSGRSDAEAGWVTADKVTGIYTRDADGQVKNLIK